MSHLVGVSIITTDTIGSVKSSRSLLFFATIAASASPGVFNLAFRIAEVPAATDCLLPSGRVISMLLIGKFQRNTGGLLDAGTRRTPAVSRRKQQMAPV